MLYHVISLGFLAHILRRWLDPHGTHPSPTEPQFARPKPGIQNPSSSDPSAGDRPIQRRSVFTGGPSFLRPSSFSPILRSCMPLICLLTAADLTQLLGSANSGRRLFGRRSGTRTLPTESWVRTGSMEGPHVVF